MSKLARLPKRIIECTSHEGVTIGLIDSIMILGDVLAERLALDILRMKEDIDSEGFSEDVENALTDLRFHKNFKSLLYPRDEVAMEIISRAAKLLPKGKASKP